MLTTISNLREISQRCRMGEPLDPALSQWLAESLDRFLRHQCPTMEEALGLRQSRGGVPWWLVEAMYARDAALRDLAEAVAGEGALAQRVREVHRLTTRYAATAWRFDQEREEMPAHYRGDAREPMWRAFKSGAPMPLGERQLRNILGG